MRGSHTFSLLDSLTVLFKAIPTEDAFIEDPILSDFPILMHPQCNPEVTNPEAYLEAASMSTPLLQDNEHISLTQLQSWIGLGPV